MASFLLRTPWRAHTNDPSSDAAINIEPYGKILGTAHDFIVIECHAPGNLELIVAERVLLEWDRTA
jgi:hypothetical protein